MRNINENTVAANLREKERAKQTQHNKEKKFGDYDWQKLEEWKLDTVTVYELDKYLKVHNICIIKRNKLDKIKLIIAHHESGKSVLSQTPVESDTDDSRDASNLDDSDIDCTPEIHHLILTAQVTPNYQSLKLQILGMMVSFCDVSK